MADIEIENFKELAAEATAFQEQLKGAMDAKFNRKANASKNARLISSTFMELVEGLFAETNALIEQFLVAVDAQLEWLESPERLGSPERPEWSALSFLNMSTKANLAIKTLERIPTIRDRDLTKTISEAIETGDLGLVNILLWIGVDPSARFNLAIRLASANGQIDVVRLLLQDERVDPSAEFNYAIRFASANGQIDVVRLLLQDERVDPSAENNYAIGIASANGHADIVRLLLHDERVDPSAENNYAIKFASANGRIDVVRLLLQDERVDPSAENNYALRMASANGHTSVVRLLLQDERVDPSVENNYALRMASRYRHADIVASLLEDPRVDPTIIGRPPRGGGRGRRMRKTRRRHLKRSMRRNHTSKRRRW